MNKTSFLERLREWMKCYDCDLSVIENNFMKILEQFGISNISNYEILSFEENYSGDKYKICIKIDNNIYDLYLYYSLLDIYMEIKKDDVIKGIKSIKDKDKDKDNTLKLEYFFEKKKNEKNNNWVDEKLKNNKFRYRIYNEEEAFSFEAEIKDKCISEALDINGVKDVIKNLTFPINIFNLYQIIAVNFKIDYSDFETIKLRNYACGDFKYFYPISEISLKNGNVSELLCNHDGKKINVIGDNNWRYEDDKITLDFSSYKIKIDILDYYGKSLSDTIDFNEIIRTAKKEKDEFKESTLKLVRKNNDK